MPLLPLIKSSPPMAAKQINAQKTNAEENLRLLIHHTDDPLWLIDRSFNIVECNKAFKKWVHCFIGRELDNGDNVLYYGISKDYFHKFEMCYRLALSGKALRTIEDIMIDDKLCYTAVSFNPVYNSCNHIIGVSCYARDITEQRRHLDHIEQQNEALREIAFIQSHRVRGPVASILGLKQLFNTSDFSDPINKEVLDGVMTLIGQLDGIIHQIVYKTNAIDPMI